MIRGLVVLDPAEITDDEWAGRVSRLQERMAADGITIAFVYGDVYRSTDIGYLSNLCIYWNEGILAVPAQGRPTFLTKLSPRVHTWMRATSKVDDLRSGKAFGPLVAEFLTEQETGVVGLVDHPLWPVDLAAEITDAAPGWEIRSLGGLVREQRLVPSVAEVALARAGASAMRRAFDAATAPGLDDRERVALLERELRGHGFTDVLATATSETVEATGQYRHGWLHLAEPLDPGWTGPLGAVLRAIVGAVVPGATRQDFAAAAAPKVPAGVDWHVTCVNQADMATGGEYVPDEPIPAGAVVVVGVEVLLGDGHRVAAARTVLAGPDGAETLEGQ